VTGAVYVALGLTTPTPVPVPKAGAPGGVDLAVCTVVSLVSDEALTVAVTFGTVMVVNLVVVACEVVVESPSSSSLPPTGELVVAAAPGAVEVGFDADADGVTAVTGHTVVVTATSSVVTWPSLPGQSVAALGGQLVMVYVLVE
jgi:hypothetical protein